MTAYKVCTKSVYRVNLDDLPEPKEMEILDILIMLIYYAEDLNHV